MGWTYTYRGSTPVKQFLADHVNCENEHAKWLILDIAIVKMRTAYMAVEIIRRDKETGQLDMTTRKVVAFVFLLDYRPSDPDYDMGYKDMDESMGPCASECPERILNLLTPTDHEYALAWRQRCRDSIGRRRSGSARIRSSKPGRFPSRTAGREPASRSSAAGRFGCFAWRPILSAGCHGACCKT